MDRAEYIADTGRPVVIGLGAKGKAAVDQLRHVNRLPNDLSIHDSTPDQPGNFDRTFDENLSMSLVFEADDTWALDQAMQFGQLAKAHDVLYRIAVVLSPARIPQPELEELSNNLDSVIYLKSAFDDRMPVFYQPLFQVLRSFFFEASLVCYDALEIKEIISPSQYGIAHFSRYLPLRHQDNLTGDIQKYLSGIITSKTIGVIAMMQDGLELSIPDYDAITTGIRQASGEEVSVLSFTQINPDLTEREAYLLILLFQ